MTTIGIIGAGHIGSQIARAAITSGYDVVISNSRGPETLTDLIAELGPKATAGTPTQAAEAGDFVIVTVPMGAISSIPVEALAGKSVIDTNNYYWERDGHIEELDNATETVTGLLQRHLPTSKVVKGFNAIRFDHITTEGKPAGTPGRRALSAAGDHPEAKKILIDLYDALGFDTVDVGGLSESWRVDRDQPAYGAQEDVAGLTAKIAAGTRTTTSK